HCLDLLERVRPCACERNERLVPEDHEGWTIERQGDGLPRLPELAENRPSATIQILRALEIEIGVRVGHLVRELERRQCRALLLDPALTALHAKLLVKSSAQLEQMEDVLEGVRLLLGGQRSSRPVVLLSRLDRLHTEVRSQKAVEAQGLDAEEAGRERRVEERRDRESVEALEIGQIVVGGVQHFPDARIGEQRPQRRERRQRERV